MSIILKVKKGQKSSSNRPQTRLDSTRLGFFLKLDSNSTRIRFEFDSNLTRTRLELEFDSNSTRTRHKLGLFSWLELDSDSTRIRPIFNLVLNLSFLSFCVGLKMAGFEDKTFMGECLMHINIHQSLISFLIHPSMTQKWLPKWLKRWPQISFKMAQIGSKNGSWNHKKPLPILKKSLPKRLPKWLLIPDFWDREWEIRIDFLEAAKAIPDSQSRSRSRFFCWKSCPILSENREWPKNEISHTGFRVAKLQSKPCLQPWSQPWSRP